MKVFCEDNWWSNSQRDCFCVSEFIWEPFLDILTLTRKLMNCEKLCLANILISMQSLEKPQEIQYEKDFYYDHNSR